MTTLAVAPDGAVYVAGITQSLQWPKVVWSRFGKGGASDGFILRLDPAGDLPLNGIRIGGSGNENLAAIALDSRGDIFRMKFCGLEVDATTSLYELEAQLHLLTPSGLR